LTGCRTGPSSNKIGIHGITLKEKVHCQEQERQKESEEERDRHAEETIGVTEYDLLGCQNVWAYRSIAATDQKPIT
jgi:hypothetical protein